MLSQSRKFGLFLVMAHQTWSQASSRLRGALQNVGLETVFRLGREDAEHAARMLGRVDPKSVSRRTDADTEGVGMSEQWERFTQQIQDLPPRHAFIRTPQGAVTRVKTLGMPDPSVAAAELAAVEARYLQTSFHDRTALNRAVSAPASPQPAPRHPIAITTRTRREPLSPDDAA